MREEFVNFFKKKREEKQKEPEKKRDRQTEQKSWQYYTEECKANTCEQKKRLRNALSR